MSTLDTIQEAIDAIKKGEVIIVVDDEDRENEGDFLIAARHATPEVINFMATHGRGLICAPLIESRCDDLDLGLMVKTNNAAFETPFTVSVDLMGNGCTTGISAHDRSKTIQALIHPETDPNDLGRPGHIFPLRAKPGGVLRRAGHTEAAIDFSRLAGFEPAGVIVEIMNEDGSMARLAECRKLANEHNIKLVSIADLIQYRLANETLIERTIELNIDTAFGTFKTIAFRQLTNDVEHLALTHGEWNEDEDVPVRVHSSSVLGDVFQMTNFGKGPELQAAMRQIQKEGKGAIVYINKLDDGPGLIEELKTYHKTQENPKAAKTHSIDSKDYGIGAQIIRDLGIRRLNILSDHPRKKGIIGYGLEITGTTPLSR